MAFIPDEAVLRSREISPPAFQLYAFYCKLRERSAGGWEAPNSLVERELKMERCQVNRMRKALLKAGWIKVMGDFVSPLMGDFNPVDKARIAETLRLKIRDAPSQNSRRSVSEPRPTVSSPETDSLTSETDSLTSETERLKIRDGASQHIRKPAHDQPMTSPERARAWATLAVGLSAAGDNLAPRLSPVEDALRLAKGWGEMLSPDQYRQLRQYGDLLVANYAGDATPERIGRAAEYYRELGKASWGLKYLYDDWPQIVAWIDSGREIGNGRTKPAHRETHNERAARETAELIEQAFASSGGDPGSDPADAGEEGIAVDFRRI